MFPTSSLKYTDPCTSLSLVLAIICSLRAERAHQANYHGAGVLTLKQVRQFSFGFKKLICSTREIRVLFMAVNRSRFVAAVFLQEGYNSSMTHHVTVTTVAYENSRPGIAAENDR